ncbi:MAG: hypothetical protein ACJAXX_001280 [Roseivirga sp.]|jgi:hypothetical protein
MKTSHLTLCLFFLFFIAACQSQDEIPIQQETQRRIVSSVDIPQVTSSLLNQLGLRNGGERFSVYSEGNGLGVAIDWDKVKQLIDTSGKQTYTFAIEDQDNDPNTFYNLIFQLTADNEPFKPYLLKYTMDDAFAESYKSGAASFDSFRGSVKKIWVQGFGNQNTSGSTLNNDGSEVIVGDECPRVTQFNNGNGSYGSGGVYVGIPPSGGGDVELLQCEVFVQATDWWTCVSSGGSTYCHITETTYEMSYENCGLVPAMSSSDDDGLCQPTDDNIPIILPDLFQIIVDLGDHPCTLYLFQQIQVLTNKGIREIIDQFAGEESEFLYKISIVNSSTDLDNQSNVAETNWINGTMNDYETVLLRDYLNTATDIAIVRTILHEAIHAYLLNAVDIMSVTPSQQQQFQSDYALLWDFYVNEVGDGSTAHHQTMAEKFTGVISGTLSEMFGNRFSNQIYSDLAWGALTNTSTFQNPEVLSNEDRERILENNQKEDTNQNAHGTACNY